VAIKKILFKLIPTFYEKKFKSNRWCNFLILLVVKSNALAQSPKTAIKLAQGITTPISYPNNINPQRMTPCDNADVRIFPSARPQSEIHLSINKQNPQALLLSANTFPQFNSWQGAYWSTDGGVNWNGSDDLPNGAFGRGDPSTAFDAAGNGYVATMNAATLFADEPNGYLMQRTNNNGAAWQPQVAGTGVLNGFDKEMITADDVPTSPFANNIYCSWSVLVGNPANDLVQFNRSTNQAIISAHQLHLRQVGVKEQMFKLAPMEKYMFAGLIIITQRLIGHQKVLGFVVQQMAD
jgi:hypothetical protein